MGMKESLSTRVVWMEGDVVCMIDQRLLPHTLAIFRASTYQETTAAIRNMTVRGAGTIGAAAGFAMAQVALAAPESRFWEQVEQGAAHVSAARPTAKNLFYAVKRVVAAMRQETSIAAARRRAVAEAQAIYDDDAAMTQAMGEASVHLIPAGKAVLTHCNAGWLAYPGVGTALAPIYRAHQQGRPVFVYSTETRPRSQGAKLTTWELGQAGVPHALIPDTAAGAIMAKGEIGLVIVGADRIAANGDTANKIGTYTLAVLAKEHKIPFYIAAPSPTFDAECRCGAEIPIEERDEAEVVEVTGMTADSQLVTVRVATPGVRARNPAFDVTPAPLITGFITECGIIRPEATAIASYLERAKLTVPRVSASTPAK